jgi:hypothetical protein
LICALCRKGRTHVAHQGQGEIEPEYQEGPASEQEGPQGASEHETGFTGQPGDYSPIQTLPPPDNYFRIESNGTTTQIEIAIPDGDRSLILQALLEFMERIKGPLADQTEAPAPKKGKK